DCATALKRLAQQAAERGDRAEAADWWRKLAAQDPLNARVAVGLMDALVAAGDRSAALHHARVYEVLMQQELEEPPDAEVLALAARIREQSAVSSAPAPGPVVEASRPVAPPPPLAAEPSASAAAAWAAGNASPVAAEALVSARGAPPSPGD